MEPLQHAKTGLGDEAWFLGNGPCPLPAQCFKASLAHYNTHARRQQLLVPDIAPSGLLCTVRYPDAMTNKPNLAPELERYLALCQRVYERLVEKDEWPWGDQSDSPNSEVMVESDDNPNTL